MTQPVAPRVIWTGPIDNDTYRVVDLGVAAPERRLVVERQGVPDAMGTRGWQQVDPLPRRVFEQMLISAGVVR